MRGCSEQENYINSSTLVQILIKMCVCRGNFRNPCCSQKKTWTGHAQGNVTWNLDLLRDIVITFALFAFLSGNMKICFWLLTCLRKWTIHLFGSRNLDCFQKKRVALTIFLWEQRKHWQFFKSSQCFCLSKNQNVFQHTQLLPFAGRNLKEQKLKLSK